MRDIYIVRGLHHLPSQATPKADVRRSQIASVRIAEALILRERIERIFHDGRDAEEAARYNDILDRESKLKDSTKPHTQDVIEWIRMAGRCRQAGVPVRWAQTESPWIVNHANPIVYGADYMALIAMVGVRSARWIAAEYIKRGEGETLVDVLNRYDTKTAGVLPEGDSVLSTGQSRLREWSVFRNATQLGSDANLLWMGASHVCPDFYRSNSGFRVVGITLGDNLEVTFDFANRDEVPDFVSHLVEKCVRSTVEYGF